MVERRDAARVHQILIRPIRFIHVLGALTAIFALAACGGGSTTPRLLLSITVTPTTPSIPNGLTQQFAATGTFSDMSTVDLTKSVSWTSGTPVVATVGATSGLGTSVGVGSTVITATFGSLSGAAMLSVTPAIIESISITPNPAKSGVGLSQPFTATGTFSDATTANVTSISSWTSSGPSIATVDPTSGIATGVALGSTTIAATIGTVSSTAPLSIITTSWFATGSLLTARDSQTATLLPSGLVVVAGGATAMNGAPIASAELYNPAAGTWSPTSSMSTPRFGHTATLLSNGMVLVVGGTNVAPPSGQTIPVLTSAELYNPVAGTWSPTGSMSTGRSGHTATALENGFVLVEGGSGTTSAELYDPVAGTWFPTGSTSNAHYGETATLLSNGKVLVAGSYGLPLANHIDTSELYDPAAGTWSATGSMSTPRYFHTATLLSNGKVLVVGGSNTALLLTASTELYDPNTATWSSTGSLSIPRENHTATLLSNGTVLVAGGNSPLQQGINTFYPPVASTELYDPVESIWTLSASMATARAFHSSTLLRSDVVLVVGGDSGSQSGALASAELYW
jgi:hypothetical protein